MNNETVPDDIMAAAQKAFDEIISVVGDNTCVSIIARAIQADRERHAATPNLVPGLLEAARIAEGTGETLRAASTDEYDNMLAFALSNRFSQALEIAYALRARAYELQGDAHAA